MKIIIMQKLNAKFSGLSGTMLMFDNKIYGFHWNFEMQHIKYRGKFPPIYCL